MDRFKSAFPVLLAVRSWTALLLAFGCLTGIWETAVDRAGVDGRAAPLALLAR